LNRVVLDKAGRLLYVVGMRVLLLILIVSLLNCASHRNSIALDKMRKDIIEVRLQLILHEVYLEEMMEKVKGMEEMPTRCERIKED